MVGVQALLSEAGFGLDDGALVNAARDLGRAMREGLGREGAGVAMIPAYVPPGCPGTAGEVVVVDAGGTHVRAARVRVQPDGRAQVLAVRRGALPGTGGEPIEREAFFDALAGLVAELPEQGGPVGFCFSYPARILPSGDGVLLRWTKEVRAPAVVGTRVGEGLVQAMQRRGLETGSAVVLNDTVAAAAAGSLSGSGPATLGLVVGTGTNMAYFEQSVRIEKLSADQASAHRFQAINMESGNFDAAPRTRFDEALDAGSADPGSQRFEKMVSGRYLGKLAGAVLAELGLVADPPQAASLEAGQVAAFLDGQREAAGWLAGAGEPDIVRAVLEAVRDRAADLVAAGLLAVVAHAEPPGGRMTVVAEGTLFWQMPGFAGRVSASLDRLLAAVLPGQRAELVRIEHANLVGAAAAALSMRG